MTCILVLGHRVPGADGAATGRVDARRACERGQQHADRVGVGDVLHLEPARACGSQGSG